MTFQNKNSDKEVKVGRKLSHFNRGATDITISRIEEVSSENEGGDTRKAGDTRNSSVDGYTFKQLFNKKSP